MARRGVTHKKGGVKPQVKIKKKEKEGGYTSSRAGLYFVSDVARCKGPYFGHLRFTEWYWKQYQNEFYSFFDSNLNPPFSTKKYLDQLLDIGTNFCTHSLSIVYQYLLNKQYCRVLSTWGLGV